MAVAAEGGGGGSREKIDQKEKDMSLYICSAEYKVSGSSYLIHAIKVADLLSCSCSLDLGDIKAAKTKLCDHCSSKSKSEPKGNGVDYADEQLLLQKVASRQDKNFCHHVGCGVYGSQILFAGGFRYDVLEASREIYVFETDGVVDPNPSIKPLPESSSLIREVRSELPVGEVRPLVVENLYALSGYPKCFAHPSPDFEAFNPKYISSWDYYTPNFDSSDHTPYFSYAISGTKIFASSPNSSVFCFDVGDSDPGQVWRQVPSMCNGGPFPFRGRALVLDFEVSDDDDVDKDDNKLMFTYEEDEGHWSISAYCLNVKNESIELLKSDMGLELPSEFCGPHQYSFVHLGGRKVCLVVASDVPISLKAYESAKVRLLVVTFEFSVSRSAKGAKESGGGSCIRWLGSCFGGGDDRTDSPWSFSTNVLATRIFEYDSPQGGKTYSTEMLGCFLLASPTKLSKDTYTAGSDDKDSASDAQKVANPSGVGKPSGATSTLNASDHGRMDNGGNQLQQPHFGRYYSPYYCDGVPCGYHAYEEQAKYLRDYHRSCAVYAENLIDYYRGYDQYSENLSAYGFGGYGSSNYTGSGVLAGSYWTPPNAGPGSYGSSSYTTGPYIFSAGCFTDPSDYYGGTAGYYNSVGSYESFGVGGYGSVNYENLPSGSSNGYPAYAPYYYAPAAGE